MLIILFKVDLGQVVGYLENGRYTYLLPVVVLIFPYVGLRARRWQRLLARQNIRCPFRSALIFYFAAIYIGLVTPGRLGELAKGVFLKQNGMADISQSLPSVVFDRLLDLYCLALLAIMAVAHLGLLAIPFWMTVLMVLACGIAPWWFLNWAKSDNGLVRWVGSALGRFDGRWEKAWALFLEGSRSLISPHLLKALLLTISSYTVYFGQVYLLARMIGLPVTWIDTVMVVAFGVLIGFVPITIAGLGTREAVLIYLFGRLGVPAASTLSFAFLYNIVYIACIGAISAMFWLMLPHRKSLKAMDKNW